MNQTIPQVSVMILTYNRSKLLKRAVLSAAGQSFGDFEIVVGDNNSTDNTREVIEQLQSQGIPITRLYHNPQVSITENRQRVLKACRGAFVAALDDDDVWIDKNKLAKQAAFLNSHSGVVLLGAGVRKVDDSGKFLGIKFRVQADWSIRRTMLLRNNFFTSTVMFRREAAERAGGFIFLENDYAEDYYCWLRLGLLGQMHNSQEVYTDYRVPSYSPEKLLGFYRKQQLLIKMFAGRYPLAKLANAILGFRSWRLSEKIKKL